MRMVFGEAGEATEIQHTNNYDTESICLKSDNYMYLGEKEGGEMDQRALQEHLVYVHLIL